MLLPAASEHFTLVCLSDRDQPKLGRDSCLVVSHTRLQAEHLEFRKISVNAQLPEPRCGPQALPTAQLSPGSWGKLPSPPSPVHRGQAVPAAQSSGLSLRPCVFQQRGQPQAAQRTRNRVRPEAGELAGRLQDQGQLRRGSPGAALPSPPSASPPLAGVESIWAPPGEGAPGKDLHPSAFHPRVRRS